ncbi:MAG: MFS transporter, partial [Acidimicrobiales bacterium]
ALDGPALRGWGWRLAFLLALPLGLVGLYIRLRIEETPGFRAVQRLGAAARTPLADTLRTARRQLAVGFWIVAAVSATFNIVFVFLPSHLATTGRVPLPRALAAALVGLLLAAGAAPLAGWLSDRVGRRPPLVAGAVALLVLTVPVTALLRRGEPGGLLLGFSLIGLALGALVPSTFLAELFPTRLRYSGLSLTYGLASALFGGTAPALATFLVRRTGDALSPAWYATGLTVVAIVCVLVTPETVGRPLDADSDQAREMASPSRKATAEADTVLFRKLRAWDSRRSAPSPAAGERCHRRIRGRVRCPQRISPIAGDAGLPPWL